MPQMPTENNAWTLYYLLVHHRACAFCVPLILQTAHRNRRRGTSTACRHGLWGVHIYGAQQLCSSAPSHCNLFRNCGSVCLFLFASSGPLALPQPLSQAHSFRYMLLLLSGLLAALIESMTITTLEDPSSFPASP